MTAHAQGIAISVMIIGASLVPLLMATAIMVAFEDVAKSIRWSKRFVLASIVMLLIGKLVFLAQIAMVVF